MSESHVKNVDGVTESHVKNVDDTKTRTSFVVEDTKTRTSFVADDEKSPSKKCNESTKSPSKKCENSQDFSVKKCNIPQDLCVKKCKTFSSDSLLLSFETLCDKLSEALILQGLKKIKYTYIVPEIFYYLIKVILGVVTFVNTNKSLTNLLSVLNGTDKVDRETLINELKNRNKKSTKPKKLSKEIS